MPERRRTLFRRDPPVRRDRCPRHDHPDPWHDHSVQEVLEDLLQAIVYLIEGELDIMANIEDINALVTQTGADARATAARVIAAIQAAQDAASAQIADLQAQVQVLIDGNASDITPAQLDAIATGLTEIDTTINAIAPAAVPVPEPTPEPEPEPIP